MASPMIPLGYGKFVRADRVFAVVPIESDERGDGRRTYVHVDGIAEPLVASRSERAILADLEAALAESGGAPRGRRRCRGGGGARERRARASCRCSVRALLAILYDIHGNLPALEAVLADAEAVGAERFV